MSEDEIGKSQYLEACQYMEFEAFKMYITQNCIDT